MRLFEKVNELQSYLSAFQTKGLTIGLVPTMGALHAGHLSLIRHSQQDNDITVISIFVNPTQFNNREDLEKYPRDVNKDIQKLKSVHCDVAFIPSEQDIYPKGAVSKKYDLAGLDQNMEGAYRPGHFDGVATVVERLFEIVKPDRAYFGEKDFQQLVIIKRLVDLKKLPIQIVPHPIERSEKGLALSSRNLRLSKTDQEKALAIYHSLSKVRKELNNYSPQELKEKIRKQFENEPLDLEYVEIVNSDNLHPLQNWQDATHARIFMAATISGVRLIDNLSLF